LGIIVSEISAFGVEHTSISKALKFGSPARKHAAAMVRNSRSASAGVRASRKSHAAAEGTWLAKNPELAKLKHRATNRPHHSQFKPADPKELSFYRANKELRSYDVVTKSYWWSPDGKSAGPNPTVHSHSSRVKTPKGTIHTATKPGFLSDKTVKSVTGNGKTTSKVLSRKWNKGRVALVGGSAAIGAGLPLAAAGLANRKEKRDAYRKKIGYDKSEIT
jgi:hypothetical protein